MGVLGEITAGGPPIVVMGVCGSGKSTVGQAIATELGREFLDGDDFHPASNTDKMKAGIPLTDEDRAPWLEIIAARIGDDLAIGKPVVFACSALKASYREILSSRAPCTVFVYLSCSEELLAERLKTRNHKFMPASLLSSQLATLQPPRPDERHISVGVAAKPDAIARSVAKELGLLSALN
mmetsp:Transcript_137388/g.293597  ORF Transcript_137388/g.293597 Transcript_137388/m.293597 type:complete len:181 (+) Transcript_137388:51-593(+)|eukprot:CAMPEP_0180494510 /NCGR_PEP_ID=MMETSP1036_2-20121128/41276_1 /TAXON_ID=632150 /ORGANISM="Azadinium spinosum, Strain 3D9" /LENGTH=180 /DNA_ID=CAMNT_0022502953 /DNA_START=51 /DNA_END=593 /DNA_ORIENTATION=-